MRVQSEKMRAQKMKLRVVFLATVALIAICFFAYIRIFGECPFGFHIANGKASCTKDHKCVLCGKIFEEHYGHKYYKDDPKDCDENLVCERCGEERKPTAAHEWAVSIPGFSEECQVCGKIKIYSSEDNRNTSYISEDDRANAITMAQELVKKELKSPSTASFPWDFNAYTVTRKGDQFTVKGYVDAQNSFGAKIRNKFEACFTLEMVGTKYKGTKIYTLIYE